MKKVTFKDKALIKESLLKNEVIAFPTETVYGLAAISTSKLAFDNLVKVKNRTPDKPFTLMCANKRQIFQYAKENNVANILIDRFMPGPLTLILEAREDIASYLTLGTNFIGVRIPDYKELEDLLSYIGVGLLVPSANKSTFPPLKNANEVEKCFKDELSLIVNEKCKSSSVPSTIILLKGENISLIREGTIKLNEILEVLKNENSCKQ